MILVGHRGCCEEHATENTISAIKCAIENKLDAIEVDLRLTKDGFIVLHHDETLQRIYDSKLIINQSTLKDLREATERHPNPIITLEEMLDFIKGFPCFLEIKSGGVIEKLDKITESYQANVLSVLSFNLSNLNQYKKSGGKYPILFLPSRKNWGYGFLLAKFAGASVIGFRQYIRFFPITIYLSRKLGMQIYIYSINRQETYHVFAKKYKVDYLCGDSPKRLKSFK